MEKIQNMPWVTWYNNKLKQEDDQYQQFIKANSNYSGKLPTKEEWINRKNSNFTLKDSNEKAKDELTLNEKAKDYWHPVKGAKQRELASMENKTHPYWGLNTLTKTANAAMLINGGYSLFTKGVPFVKTLLTQPYGLQNFAVSTGTDLAAGTVGAAVGNKLDKSIGGDGTVGATLLGLGNVYGFNKTPWKQDLNKAVQRTTPKNSDLEKVFDGPNYFEGNIYKYPDGTYSVDPLKGAPTFYVTQRDLPGGSSVWKWRNAKPNTIEFHLGHPDRPPGNPTRAIKEIYDVVTSDVPSGTYITPVSTLQSRPARFYYNGVLSKSPNKVNLPRNPASYSGYRVMMKLVNNPNIETDVAENAAITHFESGADNSIFSQLHQEAMRTKDLTKLNGYLVNKLHGFPAKLNAKGEIEFKIPIFYKK